MIEITEGLHRHADLLHRPTHRPEVGDNLPPLGVMIAVLLYACSRDGCAILEVAVCALGLCSL